MVLTFFDETVLAMMHNAISFVIKMCYNDNEMNPGMLFMIYDYANFEANFGICVVLRSEVQGISQSSDIREYYYDVMYQ